MKLLGFWTLVGELVGYYFYLVFLLYFLLLPFFLYGVIVWEKVEVRCLNYVPRAVWCFFNLRLFSKWSIDTVRIPLV